MKNPLGWWRHRACEGSLRLRFALSLVAALAIGSASCAGPTRPLAPDCVDCVIAVESMATIGEHDSTGLVPDWPVISFNGRETLLVPAERERVLRLDQAGVRVGSYGAPGDGPGELRGVDNVSWIGEHAFVVRRSDGRLVGFDSLGTAVDRSQAEPGCLLGNIVAPVLCVGEGGEGVRSPRVRVFGLDGSMQGEFTPKPGLVEDGRCVMCRAFVLPGVAGTFWAVSRRTHLVQRWNPDGRVMKSTGLSSSIEQLVHDSLGDAVPGRVRTVGVVAVPELGGIAVLDAFIRESDRIRTPVVAEVNGVRVQSEAMTRLMQVRPLATIVSVVDSSGRLVARQFFRERTLLPAGDGYVAELGENEFELPMLVLGRLSVSTEGR